MNDDRRQRLGFVMSAVAFGAVLALAPDSGDTLFNPVTLLLRGVVVVLLR